MRKAINQNSNNYVVSIRCNPYQPLSKIEIYHLNFRYRSGLKLESIELSDAGMYVCLATNTAGGFNYQVQIIV